MFHTKPSSNPRAIRLFCIPHAGAGPSAFRGWVQELRPEIEAILIQLPGREGRFAEPAYAAMEPLVRDLADAVIPFLEGEQGFAFFGNSLGALIAFETLHEIKRRTGREAAHLFVSASNAPHMPSPLPPMAGLADQDLIREVCSRYDGIPAPLLADEEFLAAVLPTLRADIQVLETYSRRAPQPLDCPITAIGGERDKTVPLGHVDGWRDQTRGCFSLLLLDEEHLYLQSSRQRLTASIREVLSNASCAL